MNFEQYFCEIDGMPASIIVDLDLLERAPVAGWPYLLRIRVFMQSPREDGLSSNEEAPILGAIEQALENSLRGAIFAGRYTLNRCRHWIFYCQSFAQVDDVEPVFRWDFRNHRHTAFMEEDPQWKNYLDFLYPDPLALVSIRNRRQCERLEQAGVDLSQAHALLHHIRNATPELFAAAQSRGFAVENGGGLTRTDTPSYEEIDLVTHPLVKLAAELGGEYQGWDLYQSTTEPSSSSKRTL